MAALQATRHKTLWCSSSYKCKALDAPHSIHACVCLVAERLASLVGNSLGATWPAGH